jgi:two-component sensor histidine kinase
MNLRPDIVSGGESARRALANEWLSTLHEPAAMVRTDGELVAANRAFRSTIGDAPRGANLSDLVIEDSASVRGYLAACSSTNAPMIGALHPSTDRKLTCRGCRLSISPEIFVVLRFYPPDSRFQHLTSTVRELNALLRQREHEKAQLQEALRDRALLYRELQHRVKNNLQMLSGLLHAAKADQENEVARAAIEDASQRFATVSSAHQLLYQLGSLDMVPAEPLIAQIIESVIRVSKREAQIDLSVEAPHLPNDLATPIALIANELLTNAVKYSDNAHEELVVDVKLRAENGSAELIVHDNGETYRSPTTSKRGSGLGLVRGLVRQLRGKFTVDSTAGTRVSVEFPLNIDTTGN